MRNEEAMCEGLLSVVIPVYNIRDYVERCVRSVLAQPDVPLEVLIVDDGSTDDSGAVCDALAAEDSRVTVIHKPNGGLSDARNYGLCHAQGEYILFMDGDDWLAENICRDLMLLARQTRADVVIGKVHFLREEMEAAGVGAWQYFAVVPDMRATGVRDGVRAYEWPAIIRAINTVDVMTATVPELDWELLKRMTDRVTHEVPGICRVCYDLTPKPVGTVEWE